MCSQNLDRLEENLKLRKKLLSLGICSSVIGPTGPQGEPGPIISSTNEGMLFVSFS